MDYNNDGRDDLAFYRPGSSSSTVPVLLANGDGSWTAHDQGVPDWANQPDVIGVPGDYNNDRLSDIAFYRPGSNWNTMPVLLANGDGSWTAHNRNVPDWANQPDVVGVSGDYNNDGSSDIAFYRPGSNWSTTPVLLANGDGSWTAHNRSAPAWANQPDVVGVPGDYNNDGSSDIAFYRPGSNWSTTPVLLANGDGSWTAHNQNVPAWANQPGVVGVPGYYNNDRLSDIAFYRPGSNWNTVPVLYANGDGSWNGTNESAPLWAQQDDIVGLSNVVGIPGDYNNDGLTDIAFYRPSSSWNTVPVLFANGDGTWTGENESAPSWAHQADVVGVPGDYNDDGRSDIAFYSPGRGWNTVPVLFSNGDGSWNDSNASAPGWANQTGVVAVGASQVARTTRYIVQREPNGFADIMAWRYRLDADRTLASYAASHIGCSAFMIGPNIALSAAHCGVDEGEMRFRTYRNGDPLQPRDELFHYRALLQTFSDTDLVLLHVEPNAQGENPGDKYGYLDFDIRSVAVNEPMYSIWVNPVSNLGSTMIYSEGRVLENSTSGWFTPGNSNKAVRMDVAAIPGASGSANLSGESHRLLVGPTSVANRYNRWAMSMRDYLLGAEVDQGYSLSMSPSRIQGLGLNANDYYGPIDKDHNWLIDIHEDIEMLGGESQRDYYWLGFESQRRNAHWGGPDWSDFNTRERTLTLDSANTIWTIRHEGLHLMPNSTYRVSLQVLARQAEYPQSMSLRIVDRAPRRTHVDVYPVPTDVSAGWKRHTFRLRTQNYPAELQLKVEYADVSVKDLTLIKEGALIDFDTHDKRRAWYNADGPPRRQVTRNRGTVEIDGGLPPAFILPDGNGTGTDWAGLVSRTDSNSVWPLTSRDLAFVRGRSYRLCFEVRQYDGLAEPGDWGRIVVEQPNGRTYADKTFRVQPGWRQVCLDSSFVPVDGNVVVKFGFSEPPEGSAYLVDNLQSEFFYTASGEKVCPSGDREDCDGDGIKNESDETDSDGDGIVDGCDTDSDNDGIPDSVEWKGEPTDMDGDGVPDHLDSDADGDDIHDSDDPKISTTHAANEIEIDPVDLSPCGETCFYVRVSSDEPVKGFQLGLSWSFADGSGMDAPGSGMKIVSVTPGPDVTGKLSFFDSAIESAKVGLGPGEAVIGLALDATDAKNVIPAGSNQRVLKVCVLPTFDEKTESAVRLCVVDGLGSPEKDTTLSVLRDNKVSSVAPVKGCVDLVTTGDTTPPVVNCPDDISIPCADTEGVVVDYEANAVDDCGEVDVEYSPPSGSVFQPGVHVVVCRAIDSSGNLGKDSFVVTVGDNRAPVIECPDDIEVPCSGLDGAPVEWQIHAKDDCGDVTVTCDPPSGSFFPPGLTEVKCEATDSSGNVSVCIFQVNVGAGTCFKRSDMNSDGTVDITDPIGGLKYLFQGGAAPVCPDAMDANDDGNIDITDPLTVLSYLFRGGDKPPAPGPLVCGPDLTEDKLGQCSYSVAHCE